MKKLISIALAAAMLAAVSVPAFAANPITKETEQTGTTIIKTSTKTGPDSPEDVAVRYTVSIPADGAPRRQILFTLLSLTSREARLSRLP